MKEKKNSMNVSDFKYTSDCENYTDKELEQQWKSMDWNKANSYINRLQIRIVKAAKHNNLNLVKRLQYLITNSFYGKALAIKRVTGNRGKETPGVDGIVWSSPSEKMKALYQLNGKGYEASPLKRVYIDKQNKKEKRPLSIPTMKDRAMQALHLLALEPLAETKADLISFGFRKYRSAHDAQRHIHNILAKKVSPQWIIEGDIKSCFDKISHSWMIENIPMQKDILIRFLKAEYLFKRKLFPTTEGAAQGGIISPTIANMVLDGMEDAIAKRFWPSKKGRRETKDTKRNGVNIVRYADDFIITAYSECTAREIIEVTTNFLQERGLELSPTKTKITNIQQGFDFLGWNFRKYSGKLITKPSNKSTNKLIKTISLEIKKAKSTKQAHLINRLNQVLKGWTNYHQPVCAKETFGKIDKAIWQMLYSWAKRRHRNKSRKWIINKYWSTIGNRTWVFKDENTVLIKASDTPIVRHIPLKLDKCPILNKDYFLSRKLKQQEIKKLAWKKNAVAQLQAIGS